MKIFILVSKLENGGLEKVQFSLIDGFLNRAMNVKLIVGRVSKSFKLELPKGIVIQKISSNGVFYFPFNLYRLLKNESPNIIITTANDIACFAILLKLFFFKRMKVIATHHLSISAPIENASGLKKIKLKIFTFLMSILYLYADSLVAVSSALANDIHKYLPKFCVVDVIYNPIISDSFFEKASQPINYPFWHPSPGIFTIIYVGRISPEKRLDILFDAFKRVREHEKNVNLIILGNGPQENWVKEYINKNNLTTSCKHLGFVQNVLPYIANSNLLILPSDYEGFGNVIVEAMGCGTQVISTDCPDGPAEILEYGKFGQLVPTGNACMLANAIMRVLHGEFLVPPHILKERATFFTSKVSIDAYCELINKISFVKG